MHSCWCGCAAMINHKGVKMSHFSIGLLLWGLISCTDKSEDRVEPEGANAGECSDSADNDLDGDYDCDDVDCSTISRSLNVQMGQGCVLVRTGCNRQSIMDNEFVQR